MNVGASTFATITSSAPIREGKWVDVVLVFSREELQLYVDGAAAAEPVPVSVAAAVTKRRLVRSQTVVVESPVGPRSQYPLLAQLSCGASS